jgi:DNA (cytosine-5)-methyltransferase 1
MGQQTDHFELRESSRPAFEAGAESLTLVDLFAGCGGLTLGAAQAAASLGMAVAIKLAVDLEPAATAVYAKNFTKANVETASIDDFFDGELGAPLTALERATKRLVGTVDLLIGGPPCQGHSSLNNHTRRDDPKNALYARMARAAEVLRPKFVLIENVPSVRHDIAGVVDTTRDSLEANGYAVADGTVSLHALGVAQRRKRHILLASCISSLDPNVILDSIASRTPDAARNLRWAIGDLENLEDPTGYDTPPRANAENLRRMNYLLDHGIFDLPNSERPKCHQSAHSYKSMYGRLNWDLPAQTITSGFGSIGQGRYMHPSRARALTPHEAARLQGFPDYFDFSAITKRGALATMIGNAVPPALAREIGVELMGHLYRSHSFAEGMQRAS